MACGEGGQSLAGCTRRAGCSRVRLLEVGDKVRSKAVHLGTWRTTELTR